MKTYIAVTLLLLGASFADAATGAPWGPREMELCLERAAPSNRPVCPPKIL